MNRIEPLEAASWLLPKKLQDLGFPHASLAVHPAIVAADCDGDLVENMAAVCRGLDPNVLNQARVLRVLSQGILRQPSRTSSRAPLAAFPYDKNAASLSAKEASPQLLPVILLTLPHDHRN